MNAFERTALAIRAFKLWNYMSLGGPMKWDFTLIRQELDDIERTVQAAKEDPK